MDLPTFQAAASAGPFDLETDHSSDESSTVVRRQSRVSTECHPDYLFTEFYGLNDNEDDTDIEDEDSDAEEDFLMAIIEAKASLASSTSS
jgi:hypothetical protein